MTYEKKTWRHGDVITATDLNNIESELETIAANTYENTQFDIDSNEDAAGSTNNKIATKQSVTRAINALDSTLELNNNTQTSLDTDAPSASYRKVLSSLTQTDGKLVSAKYVEIPEAAANVLGLIKVGDNLTINNGTLSGNYQISDTYNASTNQIASNSTVKKLIGNSISALAAISNTYTSGNYNDSQLTITSIAGNNTNGTIGFSRSPISISILQEQISDIRLEKLNSETTEPYNIPTTAKVNDLINNLTSTVSGTAGVANTITSFSQTNGTVSATFEPIAINVSQVTGNASSSANGLMSSEDKIKLDSLDATTLNNIDTTLLTSLSDHVLLDQDNKITGIKIYSALGTEYKILDFDAISGTTYTD